MKEQECPEQIDFAHFLKCDLRVGRVLSARPNPKAKRPCYIMEVDFGDFGVKQTSAQITQNYEADSLVGQQIVAVVNFPSKRVAGIKSEILVLAAVCPSNGTVLLQPSKEVDNGVKIL